MTDIKTVLPREHILKLICDNTGKRINLPNFTIEELEDFAAAVLAASAPARTQFNDKPLDGWVVTSQVNGDLLIESPSGDSASIFIDDLSPLGEVTRQLVHSLIFGSYAAPVDAQDAVDAKRLDWLMHNLGGYALNAIGVITSGNCDRDAIDRAMQASQSPQDQVTK